MWECPDLFPLGDQHILICCPQGLPARRALPQHLSGGVDGGVSTTPRRLQHGELHELDAGFEFYAPQTMQASDGRRLLVGWMGVPDGEEMLQPTRANGWIHQMTCLRELEFIDGSSISVRCAS
jgi:beta-fructofuranosidase